MAPEKYDCRVTRGMAHTLDHYRLAFYELKHSYMFYGTRKYDRRATRGMAHTLDQPRVRAYDISWYNGQDVWRAHGGFLIWSHDTKTMH